MKTKCKIIRVIPYGRLADHMETFSPTDALCFVQVSRKWEQFRHGHESGHLLIAFANELDKDFVHTFREKATKNTRLLVLNDSGSSDRLLSRMVDLRMRSAQRFYVADPPFTHSNEKSWIELLRAFLERLKSEKHDGGILDARLDNKILNVVSLDFKRLEIPISKINALAKASEDSVKNFEIDEDGSYIYWPDLDVHLGWEQLQQIVDPVAVQKAKQKSHEFNVRYGASIQKLRQQRRLAMTAIPELSEKQLRRIESGDCRLTSSAAEKLARAHGMTPNEYLQALAAVSDPVSLLAT